MANAVKSVAANPVREPFIRARVNVRGRFKSGVKACVEDGDLARSGSEYAVHGIHRGELEAIMRRSDLCFKRNCGPHRRIDKGAGAVLRTPLDNAVPDHV